MTFGAGPAPPPGKASTVPDRPTGELQAFKAAFFKALAHPVRIRILELLSRGEHSVQELQDALGVGQPVVSQQLAVLRASGIIAGSKTGVSVRYAVRDPLVGDLLVVARQIFNNQLAGSQDLLRQLRRERPAASPRGRGVRAATR
jgi:DNA-binding transcriptional ArsR family regulator